MACDLPALLRLPQEIRDEIYKHVLLETEEIHLDHEALPPRFVPSSWHVVEPRYQARISEIGLKDGFQVTMSTAASLGQVSKQFRLDVSEFLESCKLPVAARVHDFDFEHVIRYLSAPSTKRRLKDHTVREDGTVSHKLVIELSGPYDADWRKNLARWAEYLEQALPERRAEFGASHRTVHFYDRWTVRAPPEVVFGVQAMHEEWPVGAGRLELEKVRFTLCARWRVECLLNWHARWNAAALSDMAWTYYSRTSFGPASGIA